MSGRDSAHRLTLDPGRPLRLQGAALCDETTGEVVLLAARFRVGRSRHNDVRLDDASVSGEHALVEWRDECWWIRDMGSRNGTVVDGQPLGSGETVSLERGSVIEFAQAPGRFVLVDDRNPADTAGIDLDHTLLTVTAERPTELTDATLLFRVSADEETAGWSVRLGAQERDLGERVHVYLLLSLARIHAEDGGSAPADRGWTYADELAAGLGMSPATMKVQVYRCRRQLQGLVVGAAGVIERRATSNQIRIGDVRYELP